MGTFSKERKYFPNEIGGIFSILHNKRLTLRENLGPLLELESGSNDPMAYVLTILFVQIMENHSVLITVVL